jgi:hypothetical protein
MARPSTGPLVRYDQLIASGVLLNDDHQRGIVSRLQQMHDRLRTYHPPPIPDEIPRSAAGGGNFVRPPPRRFACVRVANAPCFRLNGQLRPFPS